MTSFWSSRMKAEAMCAGRSADQCGIGYEMTERSVAVLTLYEHGWKTPQLPGTG